ncbi:MAG: putative bifunctional diguanylate cyclase/phosphodiesterase [Hyphomonas sp.]
MDYLQEIIIANMSLAWLGALLLWRGSQQRAQLKQQLVQSKILSQTDALTGRSNRVHMTELLGEAIACKNANPSLIVVGLDEFKIVNDTLGHPVGDQLLKGVSDRIADLLEPEHKLARLGGDEFAVLINGDSSQFDAQRLAVTIKEQLTEPFEVDADRVVINASIGIAPPPVAGQKIDPTEMLRQADVAMYVDKGELHSPYQIYSAHMDEALQLRRTLSSELDIALANNQLELVYQPLVCARTGKVMSAEALMRWPGKGGRAASPAVFIPIAEQTGLITKLGEWTLDQAVKEIKRQKTIPIAINVSPVQFRVEGFADSVESVIKQHEINPNLLRIEITEGVLISHTGEAKRTMARLRQLGVQVLLDDFGTGYSSLSYLQRFQFDGLKIDRAFIQQLEDGRTGRQLLKSIIALGHSLNMKVIAEGVETEDQAAILQLLSCDLLQGYALGRPDQADKLHTLKPPGSLSDDRSGRAWERGLG